MSPEGVVLAMLRRGAYCDSVVLMQLQSALGELPEVLDAGVVMATAANRDLLSAAGLAAPEAEGASGEDLLIAVRAQSAAAAAAALARVDALLAERPEAGPLGSYRPRTLTGAARQLPAARWALVSVPGRFAAGVARQALDLGRHVFLYSDNVTLADEVELKRAARQRGLLVLGPDCGTAHLAGCGLGFANRVRRGAIGLVAASGTGLQAVSCRIHALGGGISQAIGTGGRDLSAAVGGATTLAALELLGRDPATKILALLGKPPSPAVASRLFRAAAACGKPVVAYFFGAEPAAESGGVGGPQMASHLEEVADLACAAAGLPSRAVAREDERLDPAPTSGFLRGLFAGGTLAVEAQRQLAPRLGVIRSNVPLDPALLLVDPSRSEGHTVVDLGDDELTVGRLHPMIDPTLRLRRLRQEAADPTTGVVLLDLVLGDGAEEDPAAALAPVVREALASAANRALAVVVAMIGTEEDPQQLADQEARLRGAGARVHRGLAPALTDCAELLGAATAATVAPTQVLRFAQDDGGRDSAPAVDLADFTPPLIAWNVGLERFATSLAAQGGEVLPLDWRPPAGGDERLAGLLARLAQRRDS